MSVPEKMQAVLFDSYGSPDVLHVAEVPVPIPAANEVLVRVRAAGVNPADTGLRAGKYKLFSGSRFPMGLGLDLAGEVAQVGTGVKDFRPGDAVYTFRDAGRPGSYAQYATVSATHLAPKPKTLGFTEAAAVPVAALTALQGLRVRGELKAGQRLLVIGASGGVGTFAVQMGKLLGAHVTGVCSTRNVELVRGLGADEIIDYTRESFVSGGRSWDVILDTVGTDYGASKKALARRGTWVTIVPSPKVVFYTALRMLPGGPRVHTFMAQPEAAQLREVAEWIDSGRLRVLVEKVYPLPEVAEAHRHSESHRARGKLVLELP
ncbi:NAD(P)-dependent alcohol dehydrogenase [Archangium violaceum]|uniref:NAD(P)-dependent alcohol dehydrogenase n=1 Tax=Archangium violaceum TaxID=83451 RepID=UPI00194EF430|nr:NAD(P)-dependent alcohol dehydrogenase [Archangium violaceum]QRN92921.1 NAD(P)-dependent alcohol dehydrogenase [Archangium violaceum]